MSDDAVWMVGNLDGEILSGPISLNQVRADLAARRLHGGELLARAGSSAWRPIAEVLADPTSVRPPPALGGRSERPPPPQSLSPEWFVQQPNAPVAGPFATELIVRGLLERRIDPNTQVCPAGSKIWMPIVTVRDFATVVRKVAPPSAPPPPPSTPAPAQSVSIAWYVQNGESPPLGPFPEEELHVGISRNAVPQSARVCRVGTQEWIPITQVPVFAAKFPIPQAPPLPVLSPLNLMSQPPIAALQQPQAQAPKPEKDKSTMIILASVGALIVVSIIVVVIVVVVT